MRPGRKYDIWASSGLILALLMFVVFEPSYGWKLRQFFTPSNIDAQGNGSSTDNGLVAENESLKAQLAELQTVQAELPTASPANYIRAMVYSRYPLNFKNELLVNAGASSGVKPGSAVLFEGLFIGRVLSVWDSYATVQTIFDNSFRMPVRIGSGGYDGLLTGGSYPFVASIAKNTPLNVNDIIVTAASGMPYAVPIGEVQSTSTSPDNLFEQAALAFPYDINGIETVLITR